MNEQFSDEILLRAAWKKGLFIPLLRHCFSVVGIDSRGDYAYYE